MITSPMAQLRNAPRHPREVRERMEVEKDMIRIDGDTALMRLTRDCRFPEAKARRLLNIAWEFGQKAEPYPGGYVHIWYHGQDDSGHVFSVIEHFGNKQPEKVARGNGSRYTQVKKNEKPSRVTGTARTERTKGTTAMPPKRTQKAAEPEPAATDEVDFQKYVAKEFSPTMADYVEWFEQNVASLDNLEVDRILVLGVSMYSHFQKSDFNIERREARRAERAQGGQDAGEPEEAPARSRTRKAPASAAPATTGRAGARPAPARAAGNGKAPAKSGKARTRATAGAAAGGDAPF